MSTPPMSAPMDASPSTGRGAARAGLPVRVAVFAIAALVFAAGAIVAFNAVVAGTFNATSTTLEANMEAAQAQDADLDAIATAQRQVDAQFADLTASAPVQLPGLRQAVRANADASAALSADLAKRIAERDTQSSASDPGDGVQPSEPSDQSGDANDAAKKLEELLAQNQQQQSDGHQQDGDSQDNSPDPDVKPW